VTQLSGILAVRRETSVPAAATLDPANQGSHVTLSNNNLAMVVANGQSGSVLSSTSKNAGKWYFEWTMTAYPSAGYLGMGIIDTNFTHEHGVGYDDPNNHSIGALFTSGGNQVSRNSVNIGSFMSGAGAGNDICACAVDFDNLTVWFRNVTQNSNWNNSGTADPSNNIGGFDFSTLIGTIYFAAAGWQAAGATGQITANFGNSFVGARPNKFKPWGPSPAPLTNITLDAANLGSGVTLSTDKLTATRSGNGCARTTNSMNSGKVYFEATLHGDGGGNAYVGFGLVNGSFGMSNSAGFDGGGNSIFSYDNDGVYIAGSVIGGWSSTFPAIGDIAAIAVDFTNKLYWAKNLSRGNMYWNNSSSANPATGVGGISFSSVTGPYYAAVGFFSTGGSMTINLGFSPFTGAIPSGFNFWDKVS
jgi:hypothetical protein